jgi:hypothetical protein
MVIGGRSHELKMPGNIGFDVACDRDGLRGSDYKRRHEFVQETLGRDITRPEWNGTKVMQRIAD